MAQAADAATMRPSVAAMVSALSRAGHGAAPGDVAAALRRGFPAWVEEQLASRDAADGPCNERLARLALRIRYPAGEKWPGVDEVRRAAWLDKPIDQAWSLITRRQEMDGAERRRPRDEVVAATILRAVHSRWQLREVLVGFWHDHFNVDAAGSEQVMVALPSYDRDVVRRHALGNFRAFLEAVATSAAMQFYLSNHASRAGAANENYGRELFELHTLGREAYLNDRYDRWRDVPGALKGAPAGYIDQDVYEAARAFTGWTIEDGTSIDGHRKLPETGRFAYVESWHDGYQKRVLAQEFQPFQPALADGRRVLDLVADHPATARFLAQKLCRRFLGEAPPPRVVAAAADAWTRYRKAPDQIARVVATILLAPEFMAPTRAPGQVKLRRPLALAAAFARAAGLDLEPNEALAGEIGNAGQRLFGYAAPTGLPNEDALFLGTNGMRRRWNLVLALAENAWGTGALPPPAGAPTARAATSCFLAAFQGGFEPATAAAILAGLGWPPDQPLAAPASPELARRWARIAAYCAMTPQFQSA